MNLRAIPTKLMYLLNIYLIYLSRMEDFDMSREVQESELVKPSKTYQILPFLVLTP